MLISKHEFILIVKFVLKSHVVTVPDEVIPLVHINPCVLVSNYLKIIPTFEINSNLLDIS